MSKTIQNRRRRERAKQNLKQKYKEKQKEKEVANGYTKIYNFLARVLPKTDT